MAYSFIVDTNQYTGNFERQLCAYMTGQIGECEVGIELANHFKKQFPNQYEEFVEIIGSQADEHGCYRPVDCYPTPGRFNSGLGNCHDDDADMNLVKVMHIQKTDEHYLPYIQRAEQAIADGKTEWEKDLAGYKERMKEARTKEIQKYPAYESIEIFFDTKPTEEQIEFLKQRALALPNDEEILTFEEAILYRDYHKIQIKGFRLKEEIISETVINI